MKTKKAIFLVLMIIVINCADYEDKEISIVKNSNYLVHSSEKLDDTSTWSCIQMNIKWNSDPIIGYGYIGNQEEFSHMKTSTKK